jgi:hypothetical protein
MRCLRPCLFALALSLPSPPAAATALYKCVLPSGEVLIQSRPCPKGSQQVWKRDTPPDPQTTPYQQEQAELRRQQDANSARELSLLAGTTLPEAPPTPPPPPPPAPETPEPPKGQCRKAHEFVDALRANNAWLELSEAQLYRADEWVGEQCRAAREQD